MTHVTHLQIELDEDRVRQLLLQAVAESLLAVDAKGAHVYLSTSCLHEKHDYCAAMFGASGAGKRPAECKFCGSRCVCPCHMGEGSS